MYNNKYFLAFYGGNSNEICQKMDSYVGTGVTHTSLNNCDLYVNQRYYTGLPDRPVWNNKIALLLHGIAFPWDISIDELAEDPEPYLKKVIAKYKGELHNIARGFRNGSYAGVVIDDEEKCLYAFTCFLNSIPVYYSLYQGNLILSTDFYLIAHLTNSQIDKLTPGLVEYYVQGTNLSSATALEHIKAIPKGAFLKYKDQKLEIGYYYVMPREDSTREFDDWVDEFALLWESTMQSLHSERFRYGLGLTGGVDSRLIFSAIKDKQAPLYYTGSHPKHPDYLLAKKITEAFGLENHILEDYRNVDKLKGYAEYTYLGDNPLHRNSLYFMGQLDFRIDNKLVYEFSGLSEFLGGVYHYRDRRNVLDTIRMMKPVSQKKIKTRNDQDLYHLIRLGLRNAIYLADLDYMDEGSEGAFSNVVDSILKSVNKQIGEVVFEEEYLERFRHIHKMANLLSWKILGNRRFLEHLSPSMNIELTDFACRIPLKFRDSRRLLLAYLRRYQPQTAKIVLSGNIFSANSPWILYKSSSYIMKSLNHLGIKIPLLQWYIRKHNYITIDNLPEIYEFQRSICAESEFVNSSPLRKVIDRYPLDKTRLMRVFNIAILEKKLLMSEESLREYLLEKADQIREIRSQKFSKQ